MSALRVALVTRSFSWAQAGGGEVLVRLLAEHLARLGHHVSVLAVDARGVAADDAPFRLVALPSLSALDVRRALAREKPDVVDAHNMESAPSAILAARSLGLPVVVTVSSAWPTCLFADMYRPGHGVCVTCSVGGVADCFRKRPPEVVGRRVPAVVGYLETRRRLALLRRADLLVAHTAASRDVLTRNGVPEAMVRLVPNFDERAFHAPHAEPDDGAERVLYVGGLTHPKGTDVLVEAFARLAPGRPAARLQLAGEGYLRPALEAAAAARGVRDRVDFLGYVPHEEVRELYRRAACVVFPVRTEETFGRVILEGWATGAPVVASDLSAPGEILRDGETGLLVKPEDPAALADAIGRVLADKALAARLAENGRKELERYAPERVVPMFVQAYEEAMASRSS